MNNITLKMSDYSDWDGNYIHKMVTKKEINKYTMVVDDKVVPCFVSKREPYGYWGYIDEAGDKWAVNWNDEAGTNLSRVIENQELIDLKNKVMDKFKTKMNEIKTKEGLLILHQKLIEMIK